MVDTIHDEQCFYCMRDAKLESLMTRVCELQASTVYLFHDQKHPGRCVVAFNGHKTELFQLSDRELREFSEDIALVAKAIHGSFKADKINYATYGDLVPHLHMHLVPKKSGELHWGVPFTDGPDKVFLSDEDRIARIKLLRRELEDLCSVAA